MSKLLQLRGGTTTEHATFTGAVREVTVDTDKDTLVIHDGSTAGGFPLPRTKADIDALNINADTLDGKQLATIESEYQSFANAAAAGIVDAAPATLDTLNELAAALGDDPNFATTVTNSIATKLPLAGGAMTGAITTNSTFDGRDVSVDGAKLDTIATNANYITNNNQLTNGAGYITSSASISGNAASATALQTGRNINGVFFNGTANITVADSTKLPLTGGTLSGTLSTPALNIGGTQVISSSRVLSNVSGLKTVGGTAILGSGDIPLPTGVPAFNPSIAPNYSITSSATWTKPSLSSTTWCVIHLIGAGGAGNHANWGGGGNGGSAVVIGAIASTLPASIAFTVGAGGGIAAGGVNPGSPGGDTNATINGRLYKAIGGYQSFGTSSNYSEAINTLQPSGAYFMVNSGVSPYEYDSTETAGGTNVKIQPNTIHNSQFGGGAGGGTTAYTNGGQTGISQFAGNGGAPNNNGVAPGGGGGGGNTATVNGNGASGGVKIWYIS